MDRDEVITNHYVEHSEDLIRFMAFRRGGSRQDGEDIVHEAYSRALLYFPTFDPTVRNFSTWFNTVLSNVYKDFCKSERHGGMTDEFDEEAFDPLDIDFVHIQDVSSLRKFIDKQPPFAIEPLVLYYVYQYSLSEIDSLLPGYGYKRVDNIVKDFRLRAMRERKL